MSVIKTKQELDNAIKQLRSNEVSNNFSELRANKESNNYDWLRSYTAGEDLIKNAVAKYNLQKYRGLSSSGSFEFSELAKQAADARKKAFMTKMSKLTNQPEETFAKSGRIDAGLVYIKWQFDENGNAYTSVDFRLTTDEVLQKLSENGLLENK